MADSVFDKPISYASDDVVPPIDFAEFEKVVRSRRSCRVYANEPVPDAVVEKCLDLAMLAPSSSNLQPWEFHWTKSADKRAALVEACLGQPAAKTAPVLIVCVARTGAWRKIRALMLKEFDKAGNVPKPARDYYEKLVPFVQTMGFLGIFGLMKWIAVSVIGLFRPLPRGPFSKAALKLWAHKSTALACENLMLSFRAAGYDSCPMEGFDARRVNKLLGLPWDASVVMVISAGRRTKQGIYGPQIRFDRELFIHRH